jgi:mono/diheme cytochrome c family protein
MVVAGLVEAMPATRVQRLEPMIVRRTLLFCFCTIGIGAAGAAAMAWQPEIAPITRPDPKSLALADVSRGATLAAIGDCAVCHTAEGGGAYAGGRAIATPFGAIYAPNITPDTATGIGTWSSAAFRRAMRKGVARSGAHLYPALPYEHFTHVDDDDLDALYAFLMTRPPIAARSPDNRLIPPLGFRPLLAGWKLLFLRDKPFVPTPGQSTAWNRGAYLIEGLGHCGACHTPRNLAGSEESAQAYAGGTAEGWNAPALDGTNPATRAWTADALYTYLRHGIDPNHSVAAGPMAPVTHDLALVPDDDVQAISVYIASLMGERKSAAPVDKADAAAQSEPEGAVLFTGACGACHGAGAPMAKQGRPGLSLVSALQADDPGNAIRVILDGLRPPSAGAGAYMPAFADALTTPQIAEIVAYLRVRYSDRPAWPALEPAIAKARKEGV